MVLCFISYKSIAQTTNHALIFAIGNYLHWPHISSLQDVSFIDSALSKRGFTDIKIVSDKDATVQGISNALENLINRVKAGDVVVIHFSSHGEQVQDDNGDESDGLDETIVTYNAMLPPRGQYLSPEDYNKFQADYFRDDLFGKYIDELRAKLGSKGDLVVFMDLCHSGTGTRGIAKIRGGEPALVSINFDASKYASMDSAGDFRENKTRGDDATLATYIVYSAAQANELDYETTDDNGRGVGSLTYAIGKVFSNLDDTISYRALFADIQTVMSERTPQQHPVVEGNGLDRTLFGGKFIRQQPYIEISKISGKNISLKAGKMQGLDSGAIVAVYPKGTSDTSKAEKLATGVVVKSTAYTSDVSLDKETGLQQAAAGWVFVSAPVYNTKPLGIGFENDAEKTSGSTSKTFSQQEQNIIKKSLSNIPLVRFDITPDLTITKGNGNDSIKIASTGYWFNTVTDTTGLKEKIEQYIQYNFLKNLNIKDESAQLEVRLVPFINGKADTSQWNDLLAKTPLFKNGQQFVLWVKNISSDDVYLNILDMQPDGIVNKVLPNKAKNIYPVDLKIAAGSERLFSNYPIKVSPPYGTEIFKVFASKQQIDMEDIATTRGEGTRGTFTVLENLVRKSYDAVTRGVDADNIGNADGSCFNLMFEIKP